jgi:hypothetical protein
MSTDGYDGSTSLRYYLAAPWHARSLSRASARNKGFGGLDG